MAAETIRIGILGATSVGKTYHFGGNNSIFMNSMRYFENILRENGLEAVRIPEIIIGLGGGNEVHVKLTDESPEMTLSIIPYTLEFNLHNKNIYIKWLDYPGHDHVAACIYINSSGVKNFLNNYNRGNDIFISFSNKLYDILFNNKIENNIKQLLNNIYLDENNIGFVQNVGLDILYPIYADFVELREIFEDKLDETIDEIINNRLTNIFFINYFVYRLLSKILEIKLNAIENDDINRRIKIEYLLLSCIAYAYSHSAILQNTIIEEVRAHIHNDKASRMLQRVCARFYNTLPQGICLGSGCNNRNVYDLFNELIMHEYNINKEDANMLTNYAITLSLQHRIVITGPIIYAFILGLARNSDILFLINPVSYYEYAKVYIRKHLGFDLYSLFKNRDNIDENTRTSLSKIDTLIKLIIKINNYLEINLDNNGYINFVDLKRWLENELGTNLDDIVNELEGIEFANIRSLLNFVQQYCHGNINNDLLEDIVENVYVLLYGLNSTINILNNKSINISLFKKFFDIYNSYENENLYGEELEAFRVISSIIDIIKRIGESLASRSIRDLMLLQGSTFATAFQHVYKYEAEVNLNNNNKRLLLLGSFFDRLIDTLRSEPCNRNVNPNNLAVIYRILYNINVGNINSVTHVRDDLKELFESDCAERLVYAMFTYPIAVGPERGMLNMITYDGLRRLFKEIFFVPGGGINRKGDNILYNLPLALMFYDSLMFAGDNRRLFDYVLVEG